MKWRQESGVIRSWLSRSASAPREAESRCGLPAQPRLRVLFSWTLAGNVIYAACLWAQVVALAKLGSVSMVGEFAYALAIAAPVFQFSNMHLRSIQATDVNNSYLLQEFFSLRLATSAGSLVVVMALGALGPASVASTGTVVLVGTFKAIEAMSDITYGAFQRRDRMDLIAVSLAVRGILGVAAVSAGAAAGSVPMACLLLATGWLMVFVLFDLRRVRTLETGSQVVSRAKLLIWNPARGLSLLRTALPLGVVMALLSLNANVPRYLLQAEVGTEAVGRFSAIAYVLTAGTMVVVALGQSVSTRLALLFGAGDMRGVVRVLSRLLFVAVVIGATGMAVAFALGGQVLEVLYSSEYATARSTLKWISVAGVVTYLNTIMGFALTSCGILRQQTLVAGLEVLASSAAGLALIPRMGLDGAAAALVVSSLVRFTASSALLYRAVSRSTWTHA